MAVPATSPPPGPPPGLGAAGRRPGPIATAATGAVARHRSAGAALLAAALLSACGSAGGAAGPAPTPPATTAATVPATTAETTPATTAAPTTTTFAPTLAESSAEAAVDRLLATWDAHDPGSAAQVATPASVSTLFAVPPRPLDSRGCSDGQGTITCSYADRSAGGDFYEIDASQAPGGGWFVSDVQLTPLS